MTASRPRALVTGGCGFIGSHLVDLLLDEGHEVVVVDDLSTGRLANLSEHEGARELRIVQADVCDVEKVAPEFEGVSTVFHLAALADIVPSIERPHAYMRANVMGTLCALEAARRAGVQRFVYSASSSCYGLATEFPTPEHARISPEYPYALTKWLGEETVMHWGKVYGMPVVSLRYFNVYGPRSRTTGAYGAVFGVFLAQKINGKPFTVVGDGTQERDFVFVTDVARANLFASRSTVRGEIFNVGTGQPQTVNRLIQLLGGGPVTHVPKRPGEPDRTQADTSKIEKVLGWKAAVTFEDGVKAVERHIDDWRDAPIWDRSSIERATREWFRHMGH